MQEKSSLLANPLSVSSNDSGWTFDVVWPCSFRGALFDSFTVGENIQYPMIEHKWGDRPTREKQRHGSLGNGRTRNIEKLYPSEISGGMQTALHWRVPSQ